MQSMRFVNPEWLVESEAGAAISDGGAPEEIRPPECARRVGVWAVVESLCGLPETESELGRRLTNGQLLL